MPTEHVKIQIVSGPFYTAAVGMPAYFTIGDKTPAQCFDALIALKCGWEVEYSDDISNQEYTLWARSDILCRMVRAEAQNKPIFFDHGQVIQYEDMVNSLLEIIQNHGELPMVAEDTDESLVLTMIEEGDETLPDQTAG
jgi:hypothetical protein